MKQPIPLKEKRVRKKKKSVIINSNLSVGGKANEHRTTTSKNSKCFRKIK